MKNRTKIEEQLLALISSPAEGSWESGMELIRSLGYSTEKVLEILGLKIELRPIPAGTGYLGENGAVEVEFEEFEMAATATTRQQYAALMFTVHDGDENLRWTPGTPIKNPEHPVSYVSAYDAEEFCRRLSDVLSLDQGADVHARLPLSAEWEYAAKAGTDYKYAGSDDPDEVAWHAGNSGFQTHPVGQLKPNDWDLYDMSGNVYEWLDCNWEDDDAPGAKSYEKYKKASLTREEWDARAARRKDAGE